jgi:hypothetical protein
MWIGIEAAWLADVSIDTALWSLWGRLENFCFDMCVGLKFSPTSHLPLTTC